MKKKEWGAHRLSYHIFKGDIPDGMWVLHKCDNRKCCNPEHLFLGDVADNMLDAFIKGRFTHRYKFGHRPLNAKLSNDTVITIKKMISDGTPLIQISKQLNVSRYTINDIKRGRAYAEIGA